MRTKKLKRRSARRHSRSSESRGVGRCRHRLGGAELGGMGRGSMLGRTQVVAPVNCARVLIAIAALLAVALLAPATSAASSFYGASTGDGSKIVFESNDRLVKGDTDHSYDVYRRSAGTTILLSRGEINGDGAFKALFAGASSDCSKVFFTSDERLVSGDTDNSADIYKRSGGTTIRVSAGQTNGNGAFDASFEGASNDGSKVFFTSEERLVGADTDNSVDVYKRSGGATRLVSRGQINGSGAFDAAFAHVTSDGSKVLFSSNERLVSADTDNARDIYKRSRRTTKLVSQGQINGNGANYAFFDSASADGSKVWFHTDEKLVSDDTDSATDVYQRSGGTSIPISRGQINGNGEDDASFGGVTSDGSKVWFQTDEPLVSDDTDSAVDVYQRSGGATTLISRGQVNGNGNFDVFFSDANSDGSRVFFSTEERLVTGDVNDVLDGYERFQGKTIWVTQGPVSFSGSSRGSFIHAIANDGATVYFDTDEPLVSGDTDSSWDSYQRSGGITTRISRGQVNGNGEFDARFLTATGDGSRVFFDTEEPLVRGDRDRTNDIYERSGGKTKLVSA